MNVYFTASIVGKKYHLKKYLFIIDFLRRKKHLVESDHIIQTSEDKIRLETKEERITFHASLVKKIRSCDFMIVEASFPSISVGYEISLALHFGKPVLILFFEGDPPALLAHHEDEKLICERYTLDTVGEIIDEFVNYVEGKQDSRFTFFITPHIDHFLDEISRKQKLPKSVYLRKLIEREMKGT